MRKKLAASALAIGAAAALGLTIPADAAPAKTQTSVAPITCQPYEDSCVLDYVGNGGNGYWMARQQNGTTWVRLTLVPGWSTQVAPITCKYEDSCVLDFYNGNTPGAYWRARQAEGSTWVRLTLVNGQ